MSGAGDGRWRRPGNQQQNQSQTQTQPQAQSQPQSTSRERQNRQSVSGNAWTQKDHKAKSPTAGSQPKSTQPQAASSPTISAQVEHLPIKGFNSVETRQFLKRGYQDAIKAAGDEKQFLWRPQDTSTAPRQAWGTRTDRMAGNRDFWSLLRREVANAGQSKSSMSG